MSDENEPPLGFHLLFWLATTISVLFVAGVIYVVLTLTPAIADALRAVGS